MLSRQFVPFSDSSRKKEVMGKATSLVLAFGCLVLIAKFQSGEARRPVGYCPVCRPPPPRFAGDAPIGYCPICVPPPPPPRWFSGGGVGGLPSGALVGYCPVCRPPPPRWAGIGRDTGPIGYCPVCRPPPPRFAGGRVVGGSPWLVL